MILRRLVLPEPFGPTMPTFTPGPSSQEKSPKKPARAVRKTQPAHHADFLAQTCHIRGKNDLRARFLQERLAHFFNLFLATLAFCRTGACAAVQPFEFYFKICQPLFLHAVEARDIPCIPLKKLGITTRIRVQRMPVDFHNRVDHRIEKPPVMSHQNECPILRGEF